MTQQLTQQLTETMTRSGGLPTLMTEPSDADLMARREDGVPSEGAAIVGDVPLVETREDDWASRRRAPVFGGLRTGRRRAGDGSLSRDGAVAEGMATAATTNDNDRTKPDGLRRQASGPRLSGRADESRNELCQHLAEGGNL